MCAGLFLSLILILYIVDYGWVVQSSTEMGLYKNGITVPPKQGRPIFTVALQNLRIRLRNEADTLTGDHIHYHFQEGLSVVILMTPP